MAISLRDAWDISEIRLPGQSVFALILSPKTVPKVSAYRLDDLFETVIGFWGGHPNRSRLSKDLQEGLCAVLSGDLVAQERSLSFTYRRPAESCSSLAQMYFGKHRASRINLFWSS